MTTAKNGHFPIKISFGSIRRFWNDFFDSEPNFRVKISIAIVFTLTTLWIGYAYADQGGIFGWQFWTWLTCVIFILVLFYTNAYTFDIKKAGLMLGLFGAAFFVRVIFLDMIPGLFHIDEAGVAQFARDSIHGSDLYYLNPFVTGPSSQPTLHHYILHFSMEIFGYTVFGLRITSVIAGSLGVLVTYLMVKQISGKTTALIAAAMMITYHFAVHYSRVGLNNIWDNLWVPLVVYGFFKGWKERWNGGAVIAGAAFGFSQYFYHGSKISAFILLFMVFLLWKENKNLIEKLKLIVIVCLVAFCIAGPIFLFMIKFPEAYLSRANQVWGWKPEAIEAAIHELNYWKFLQRQVIYSLGTYLIYPDPSGFYGPTIPLVFGPAAVMFIAGLVICVIEKNWIPLVWLFVTTFFGGFLMDLPNSSSHYVASIPAICWVVGMALNWIRKNKHPRLAYLILGIIIIIDLVYYFYFYVSLPPRDFNIPFPPLPTP